MTYNRLAAVVIVIVLTILVVLVTTNNFTSSSFPTKQFHEHGARSRGRHKQRRGHKLNKNDKRMRPFTSETVPKAVQKLIKTDCPRVRRDWHDLTQEERNLYLDGWWKLYEKGTVGLFYASHEKSGIHGHVDFIVWHRYYLYEFESRIRALGGKWKCFAMPYWDWSRLAGKTVAENPMWKQGLGGNGVMSKHDQEYHREHGHYFRHGPDAVHGGCVPKWKKKGFKTGDKTKDCLRRRFHKKRHWYQSTEQTLNLINSNSEFSHFERKFEHWHNNAHDGVGGHLATMGSTNDPIFYLLHSYVDLVWSLRQDCHGYDYKLKDWQENTKMFTSRVYSRQQLYPYIKDKKWAVSHYMDLYPAQLIDFHTWGYMFDLSDMIKRTHMKMANCHFKWFKKQTGRTLPIGNVRQSDDEVARLACEKAFRGCSYTEPLEGCDEIHDDDISLDVVVNRRGVKGNECLEETRRAHYGFMKQIGQLRALCDGEYDPVC